MRTPPTVRRRIVGPKPWIAAFLNGGNSLLVNSQFTGYHRQAGPWNSQRRVLDDQLLYLATGGTCDGAVRGKTFRLEAGMLLWIPAGVPHEIRYESFDHYVLRFQLGDAKRPIGPRHQLLVQRDALELTPLLDQVRNELLDPSAWTDQRLRACLVLFFTALFRLRAHREEGARLLDPFRRSQLIDYIHAHIGTRIEPAVLAQHVGLSHDYFSRLFHSTFGTTPRCWLMRERIRLASMRMMVSHSPLKQIAGEFGYRDVALFSRQFKQVMGRSPRAYRKGRPRHEPT